MSCSNMTLGPRVEHKMLIHSPPLCWCSPKQWLWWVDYTWTGTPECNLGVGHFHEVACLVTLSSLTKSILHEIWNTAIEKCMYFPTFCWTQPIVNRYETIPTRIQVPIALSSISSSHRCVLLKSARSSKTRPSLVREGEKVVTKRKFLVIVHTLANIPTPSHLRLTWRKLSCNDLKTLRFEKKRTRDLVLMETVDNKQIWGGNEPGKHLLLLQNMKLAKQFPSDSQLSVLQGIGLQQQRERLFWQIGFALIGFWLLPPMMDMSHLYQFYHLYLYQCTKKDGFSVTLVGTHSRVVSR